jgi:hypothetical protein
MAHYVNAANISVSNFDCRIELIHAESQPGTCEPLLCQRASVVCSPEFLRRLNTLITGKLREHEARVNKSKLEVVATPKRKR